VKTKEQLVKFISEGASTRFVYYQRVIDKISGIMGLETQNIVEYLMSRT
jgi:hypothetical protein